MAGMVGFAVVLLLPAPSGMGAEAHKIVAVAVLMVSWWISEAVHIGVTGFVPIALFPLLGVESSRAVAEHYGNHLIFLFIGGFVIAQAMERWNLHRRIALAIIARFGSRPRPIVLGFMVATASLSMWISNTATTMMLLPMAMAVVNQLSVSARISGAPAAADSTRLARDTFGPVLLLGIAYAASIGGLGTVVGSPTTVAFLGFASEALPDLPSIGFARWSMMTLPLIVVFLPLTWLYLCRFGAPIPLSAVRFASDQSVIRRERASLGAVTRQERLVMIVAGSTGLLWVLRAPIDIGGFYLPGWSQLFPVPGAMHDSTVAMTMAIILFMLPSGQAGAATRLLDWKQAALGLPWGIVFLLGGGFALAAGIADSGLAAWIGAWLGALGGLPSWVLVVTVCALTTAMTETTSNVATVLMLAPAIVAMAGEVDVHPYLLLVPMAVTSSFAFVLPVATPPNAIIFSSGWITIPQMARAGIWLDIIGLVMVPMAIYGLGSVVFGFG